MKHTHIAIFVTSMVSLVGCSILGTTYDATKEVGQTRMEDAKKLLKKPVGLSNVHYSDDFYVPQLSNEQAQKPSWFFHDASGTYAGLTLEATMRAQVAPHGVNVRFDDELQGNQTFNLYHKGTVGELLEKIRFATKLSFTVEKDTLSWSKFETAQIRIANLAGYNSYKFGSQKDQNSGSSQGAQGQTSIQTIQAGEESDEYSFTNVEKLSLWDDLEKSLALFKSAEGQIQINQSTNSVLVRDYPDNVAQVRAFLESENKQLMTNIYLDIKFVEFNTETGDRRALNLDLIKQSLGGSGQLEIGTGFDNLMSTGEGIGKITWSKTEGDWSGSKAFIDALNKYGVVSDVSDQSVSTRSNQVASVDDGRQTFFILQSGSNTTANVGVSSTVTQGVVKTGSKIHILPVLVGDNVVIRMSSNISDLESAPLRKPVGDTVVESPAPQYSSRKLEIVVKDGETIMLSATTQQRDEYQENSNGGNIALGGKKTGKQSKRERLILITPRIGRI